jgi:hypothetical protein
MKLDPPSSPNEPQMPGVRGTAKAARPVVRIPNSYSLSPCFTKTFYCGALELPAVLSRAGSCSSSMGLSSFCAAVTSLESTSNTW